MALKIWNFDYTGSVQSISLQPGKYQFEVWGAQGGKSDHGVAGGNGGYSVGTLLIDKPSILYVYVGQMGQRILGGFNGGGNGHNTNSDSAGGGGATDIRLNGQNLSDRIIVAGAGGGSGCSGTYGGVGGGLTGGDGTGSSYAPGKGATQQSGGTNGGNSGNGTLGQGGTTGSTYAWPGAGGGGGYYGGGAGANLSGGGGAGGGGSGFVHPNMQDAKTVRGDVSFIAPNDQQEVGHTGNGYARISLIKPFSMRKNSNIYKNTEQSNVFDIIELMSMVG